MPRWLRPSPCRAEWRGTRAASDDRHVQPEPATRGGDFESDETGAHDGYARTGFEGAPNREGVLERAQRVHACDPFRAGEGAGGPTGGDDERVEGNVRVVVECDAARERVERYRAPPKAEIDIAARRS